MTFKLPKLIPAALALCCALAIPVAGIAQAKSTKSHHHHHKAKHHSTIPQNNGGDRDADNNGGPSDGDGNI